MSIALQAPPEPVRMAHVIRDDAGAIDLHAAEALIARAGRHIDPPRHGAL